MKRRTVHVILGPAVFAASTFLFQTALTKSGAMAVGVLLWMVYWWVTRPVHMAVTAFLPIMVNGLFHIIDMGTVTSQYFSDSIILIFGSGLLTIPWAATGLDKRVALKILSVIGPSMKSQIIVWMFLSTILSTTLPNVAVVALLTPIAVAMLRADGYEDMTKAAPAVPIFLCIGWGAGIGGAGSPLGGAMNVAAISFFQEYSGHEFMYIDWIIRMLPYFVTVTVVMIIVMILLFARSNQKMEGTKDYFKKSYRELGPVKRDEKICGIIFILAVIGVFTRPFFADLLPAFAPAFIFVTLGAVLFLIPSESRKKPLLTWEEVEENSLWGMMFLFGGGLALGKMINLSGAGEGIGAVMMQMNLDGGLMTVIVLVLFATVISEFTNSTVSASVTIPIALGFASRMGLNPLPFWFITIMGYNGEFLLPISVRAIPVGYGLDPSVMFKKGIPVVLIRALTAIVIGYLCLKFWPAFGHLSYL